MFESLPKAGKLAPLAWLLLAPIAIVLVSACLGVLEYALTRDVVGSLIVCIIGHFVYGCIASIRILNAAAEHSTLLVVLVPVAWIYTFTSAFYGYLAVLAAGPRFC